ncbi:hypothetical protein AZE42_12294, partial [Rhizopogon vesiculosus]
MEQPLVKHRHLPALLAVLLIQVFESRVLHLEVPTDNFQSSGHVSGTLSDGSVARNPMAIFVEPLMQRNVNLIQLWRELDTITSGLGTDSTGSTSVSSLIHLAMHILSIVPNSAAMERILSQFGVIHNKVRNRLDPEKVRKQALVKSDTIAQHGSLRQRKRKFFANSDDESESNHYPSNPHRNPQTTA